jgi:hypothetical protein
MTHFLFTRRRGVFVALGALVAASIAWSAGAVADSTTHTSTTTTAYSADCAAHLLTLSMGGNVIPIPAVQGCGTADGLLPLIDLTGQGVPLVLHALYESTSANASQSSAQAQAGVLHLLLPLGSVSGGQLPDISLDVLTSDATCHNGVAAGSSKVVDLVVGGQELAVPGNGIPDTIDLSPVPLKIVMNEQLTSSSTSGPTVTGPTTVTSGSTTTTTTLTQSSATHGVTQRALHVTALSGTPLAIDLVVAESHVSCTTTTTTTDVDTTTVDNPPPPPPPGQVGWMTGGGKLAGDTVTHSLVLPCTLGQAKPHPHLDVVWGQGHFQLTGLRTVGCSMVAGNGDPEQPDAPFNTLTGTGTGTCGGHAADVAFTFTDGGEPNQGRDMASIRISGAGCSLDVSGPTANGNQQAHQGPPPAS